MKHPRGILAHRNLTAMPISWNHAQSFIVLVLCVIFRGVSGGCPAKNKNEVPWPEDGDHRGLCVIAHRGVQGAAITSEEVRVESMRKVGAEERFSSMQPQPDKEPSREEQTAEATLQAGRAQHVQHAHTHFQSRNSVKSNESIVGNISVAKVPTALQALLQASEAHHEQHAESDLHASADSDPDNVIAETWLGSQLPTAIQATLSSEWHKVEMFQSTSPHLPSSGKPTSHFAPRGPPALSEHFVAPMVLSLRETSKNDVLAAIVGPLLIVLIVAIFMRIALATLQVDIPGTNRQRPRSITPGQAKREGQHTAPPSSATLTPSKVNLPGRPVTSTALGQALQGLDVSRPMSPRRSVRPVGPGQQQANARPSTPGFASPPAGPSKQGPVTPNWMVCSQAASGLSLPPRLSQEPAVPHLCMELVVPEETECNLLVPDLVAHVSETRGRISVNDTSGVPVFHATFNTKRGLSPQQDQDHRRLVLWSAIDGLVFGCCRDAEASPTGQPALQIFNHADMPFGFLRPSTSYKRGAFSVTTCSGREIIFYKTNEAGTQRAEDETGRLLAMVITSSPRSIRIGPEVDAGLVTLGMLGVDLLSSDARTVV